MKCEIMSAAGWTFSGRSPCGERGLKSGSVAHMPYNEFKSLPVRGAWVEIVSVFALRYCAARRSPCGERGLK